MRHLPLYPSPPLAAVEQVLPMDLDKGCGRCPLGEKAKTRCVPADGVPGGLLVVGEYPGRDEDLRGRPFVGTSGKYIRTLLGKLWQGPVVYDNAVRCHCTHENPRRLGAAEACRCYLSRVILDAAPSRVLAVGSMAIYALLDRSPPILSVRRGYGWLLGQAKPVPIFLLPNPAAVLRNRFVRAWFESDLAWALAVEVTPHTTSVADVVQTPADAEEACRRVRSWGAVAFDTETAGLMFDCLKVISVAMSAGGDCVVWDAAALADEGCRAPLVALLNDPRVPKVAHNWKFDRLAARSLPGCDPRGLILDTMLFRRIQEAHTDAHLEVCAELVGLGDIKVESKATIEGLVTQVGRLRDAAQKPTLLPRDIDPVVARGIAEGWDPLKYVFALLPPDELARRNARDALATARLGMVLEDTTTEEASQVWTDLVRPAADALVQVEAWGVCADPTAIETFARWLDVRQVEVLRRLSVYSVNFSSPKQVATLLYKTLGLPCRKETDGGQPSTDEEALTPLLGTHQVVEDILAWRGLVKLRGTYADGGERSSPDEPFALGRGGLLGHVRPDGRIHPTLRIDGAESGRLSCQEPNLQNLPRADSDEGRLCRNAVVASPGCLLVECDYSQIELRIAAALSGDKVMRGIYERGEDLHHRTAQLIGPLVFNKKPEDILPDGPERPRAKVVNFSLGYGKSDAGLAADLHCTVAVARGIREAVLGQFKGFAAWIEGQKRYVAQHGYVWTVWSGKPARKRWLWQVADADRQSAGTAERSSYNTPIQGTANDYALDSLTRVVEWIKDEGIPAKVVLTVHDELLMDVQEDAVEEVCYVVPRLMTQRPCSVPLAVDVKVGRAWGAMSKWKSPKIAQV